MKHLFAAFALAATLPASAIVIVTSSQTPYLTAPPDDPGFANVGSRGASGIYLGMINGAPWALTARHVGAGPLTVAGMTYANVPGSEVIIRNPDNTLTDLVKFRLASAPPLPTLRISSSTVPLGAPLVMVGFGLAGANARTTYYANTSNTPWTWSTDPGMPHDFEVEGYAYSGGGKRWASNNLEDRGIVDYGLGPTALMGMYFDDLPGEGMAAGGDSGGAVFYKRGSDWELAGVLTAIGRYSGQGSGALFGEITVAAELTAYYSQIVPEPSSRAMSLITLCLGGMTWDVLRRRRVRA